jgi:hypothetical protein
LAAVEDEDLEVRILLHQANPLGGGRRGDRVDRRVVERHPAVVGATGVEAKIASRIATMCRSLSVVVGGWR